MLAYLSRLLMSKGNSGSDVHVGDPAVHATDAIAVLGLEADETIVAVVGSPRVLHDVVALLDGLRSACSRRVLAALTLIKVLAGIAVTLLGFQAGGRGATTNGLSLRVSAVANEGDGVVKTRRLGAPIRSLEHACLEPVERSVASCDSNCDGAVVEPVKIFGDGSCELA